MREQITNRSRRVNAAPPSTDGGAQALWSSINELRRELRIRQTTYKRFVADGRMAPDVAQKHYDDLLAAHRVLMQKMEQYGPKWIQRASVAQPARVMFMLEERDADNSAGKTTDGTNTDD